MLEAPKNKTFQSVEEAEKYFRKVAFDEGYGLVRGSSNPVRVIWRCVKGK